MSNQQNTYKTNAKSGAAVAVKMSDIVMPVEDINLESNNGFNFSGVDSLGNSITSFINVPTVEQARFELEKAGIIVDSISPRKTGKKQRKRAPSKLQFATFAKDFGEQMSLGDAAPDILDQLASDLTNQRLIDAIKSASLLIRNGSPVYEAFAQQKDKNGELVFPIDFIYSIKIAEVTGSSENPETGEVEVAWISLLNRFAEGMIEMDAIEGKIKSASYYPVGIFVFCIGAVLLVLYAVMPKFKEMYEALLVGKDNQLPFITQILVTSSDFLLSIGGLITILGIGAGLYYLKRWFKTPKGQLWWQYKSLKLPVFGSFYINMHAAKSLRVMSMLSSGESDIKKRFSITAETCSNIVFKKAFEHMSHRLSFGLTITEVTVPYYSLFSSDFRSVARSIDKVGDMQGRLYQHAKILETRAKRRLERAIALFETFAIVPVCILIGFIVIALYAPLLTLVGRLSGGAQ